MEAPLAAAHRIFRVAVELTGDEREAWLREQCGGDAALRAELDALLRCDADPSFFAETRLDAVRRSVTGIGPLPERIAEFEVLDVLGRGGMGIVYRGRQRHPEREVAIKVLAPDMGGPEARARFALETEALGRLQHPGIAQIHAAGTWSSPAGEQPYLAMELVRGVPLHEWASASHASLPSRLRVLIELCEAVHHAHQRGLIHRDLKPGNVFVDEHGHVKVLDFGIARLVDAGRDRTLRTKAGELLGTLAYMSPEQASGEPDRVDVRADVYAAGVLGYQLLSGRLPIAVDDATLADGLRRLAEQDPRPLGEHDERLRGDLQTIFGKALRKEPEQRYASMEAFADDLRRFLAHEPIAARPATIGYLTARFARRHRGLVAGGLLAFCAMVGGTVASVIWAMRADAEAAMATSVTTFVEELFSEAAPEIAQGRELSVRELVLRGAKHVETGLSEQPLRRARLMRLLGSVLSAMGDGVTALPLAEQALELLERELSADDPRVLDAKITLAGCRYAKGDVAGAAPLFAEVLAKHERAGRGAGDLFACCHEGLGACASIRGDLDAALHHYTVMQDARRDDPSPDVRGLDLMRLGVVRNQRGEMEQAERLFERAYALLREGTNLFAAAQLASNLGVLRIHQERPDDAEKLFREALALGERVVGPDHPIQMRRLCNLAGLLSKQGRIDESEPLLVRALAIGEAAGQTADEATANVLMNLGNVRLARERAAEALQLYERAAAIYERLGGARSQDLAEALENMVLAHEALGADAQAQALRARIAAIRRG
ncbi:MAG: serine/threonine protein kinase [Planctomycetes bacterium]|nr:serine/threonine protein kinase [Planctomycetota bacterium]